MNDIIFSNSFFFKELNFDTFHYTDNRGGAMTHYFAYMISGRCTIVTEYETVHIKEGDVFYIPFKCSYQSYWYGEPAIKFISLGFAYLPNFEKRIYPVQVISDAEQTVDTLLSLGRKNNLSAGDIGTFYTLVGTLLPNMSCKSQSRTGEIVEKTQKYLTEHPYAKTSELARNCAISEAALYSAFRKSSDITPNQLRNAILLEKAKETLITTDKPIEYISDVLEFSSPSYFRKKFKQHFKMTPREMRNKYRF